MTLQGRVVFNGCIEVPSRRLKVGIEPNASHKGGYMTTIIFCFLLGAALGEIVRWIWVRGYNR